MILTFALNYFSSFFESTVLMRLWLCCCCCCCANSNHLSIVSMVAALSPLQVLHVNWCVTE
jgi:hypothetical protein